MQPRAAYAALADEQPHELPVLGLQEDAEVFAFLLEYLYTDRLERLPQHLLRAGGAALLLDAADRYLVPNLKVRLPGPRDQAQWIVFALSLRHGGQMASQPWTATHERLSDFCMVRLEHAEGSALLLVAADIWCPSRRQLGCNPCSIAAATWGLGMRARLYAVHACSLWRCRQSSSPAVGGHMEAPNRLALVPRQWPQSSTVCTVPTLALCVAPPS